MPILLTAMVRARPIVAGAAAGGLAIAVVATLLASARVGVALAAAVVAASLIRADLLQASRAAIASAWGVAVAPAAILIVVADPADPASALSGDFARALALAASSPRRRLPGRRSACACAGTPSRRGCARGPRWRRSWHRRRRRTRRRFERSQRSGGRSLQRLDSRARRALARRDGDGDRPPGPRGRRRRLLPRLEGGAGRRCRSLCALAAARARSRARASRARRGARPLPLDRARGVAHPPRAAAPDVRARRDPLPRRESRRLAVAPGGCGGDLGDRARCRALESPLMRPRLIERTATVSLSIAAAFGAARGLPTRVHRRRSSASFPRRPSAIGTSR